MYASPTLFPHRPLSRGGGVAVRPRVRVGGGVGVRLDPDPHMDPHQRLTALVNAPNTDRDRVQKESPSRDSPRGDIYLRKVRL
ncbi:hypothetical protein GCM10009687_67660 [Asanoa iriomotensis]|uniref:Uncharacterized protein n=1 Tax=Asanoa iriomotensis TaxID=234613 RepID=A0ABQ4CGG8_9ACTN|nr:hypothetical protein Air01nite_79450 [Asanoa iriomotensis]